MKSLPQLDESLLFGRTQIVNEVVANCRAERFTVIFSEPGLGVTSLLRQGIAPALRNEGFVVVYFNDWQGRFFASELREAIANAVRETVDPSFFAQSEQLTDMLDRIQRSTGAVVALLLDQFEDYTRCHQNSELSDSFEAQLSHITRTRKCACVIGLHDLAASSFERLTQNIPNLGNFQIRLTPISEDAARESVVAEAHRARLTVEPAALDAIVSCPVIRTDEGLTHPFFLRIATHSLLDAEARRKSGQVTAANIESLHGVDRVVLEYLDEDIRELPSTHQELLFRWCNILISPEHHRLAVTEKGLTDYAGKLNRWVPPLLQRLTELQILRLVEIAGVVRYEIARESYVPLLRDWWERREAAIIARRRAQFRARSIGVAASAILLSYVVWLIFSK